MKSNKSYETRSMTSKGLKSKRSKPRKGQWPPLRIQFDEGFRAFSRGILKNPYGENNVRHKEWLRGWNTAYFDNKNKLKGKKNGSI